MLQFEHEGQIYSLMFRHKQFSAGEILGMEADGKAPRAGITHCFIASRAKGADPKEKKTIAQGIAECSTKDKYSPEIGRLVALKKAMISAWGEKPCKLHELAIKCYMKRPRKYKLEIPSEYKLTFNIKPVEVRKITPISFEQVRNGG